MKHCSRHRHYIIISSIGCKVEEGCRVLHCILTYSHCLSIMPSDDYMLLSFLLPRSSIRQPAEMILLPISQSRIAIDTLYTYPRISVSLLNSARDELYRVRKASKVLRLTMDSTSNSLAICCLLISSPYKASLAPSRRALDRSPPPRCCLLAIEVSVCAIQYLPHIYLVDDRNGRE